MIKKCLAAKLEVKLGFCSLPFSGKFPNEYTGSVAKLLLTHCSMAELCFSRRRLYLILV